MKKYKNLIYCSILLFIFIQVPYSKAKSEILNDVSRVNQSSNLSDDTIRSLIYPYITYSIEKYYGENVPSFILSESKLSITKPNPQIFDFIITVQVNTYYGPLNPPYGIDTIKIETSPLGTKVIDFKHEEEKLPTG
jgi:hypothetical protein